MAVLTGFCVLAVTSVAAAPATAQDEPVSPGPDRVSEVSVFYYPWYATPDHDGHWSHWEQKGRVPPISLGANFYPSAGPYSSSDSTIINTHLQQIAAAGIDTVVVSWWGRGSYEDAVLQQMREPAARMHLTIAAHIEPYDGRTDRGLRGDFEYLREKGVRTFYVYQAQRAITQEGVRAVADIAGDDRVYVETSDQASIRSGEFMQWAADAHADGVYTYDPRGFQPVDFTGICFNARLHGLACIPSVGPGWDATRATNIRAVVNRRDGDVYDRYWQAAIDARADIVSITSFNEWHEGTQIEPAGTYCISAESYCYSNYEGAYGKSGADASFAYLTRTLHWSTAAKGRPPSLVERLAVVNNALQRDDKAVIARIRAVRVNR